MFFGLKEKLIIFLNTFLNLIYKQKCIICGCSKTDDLLCKNCLKDVEFLSCFTQRIYKNIPIYCAMKYEGNIKTIIRLLKFSHRKKAAIVLSKLLFDYYKQLDLKEEFIIVYPSSIFSRKTQRGYEHMELIAKEFSKLTGFKYKHNLIKKVKKILPQYKAKNRFKNVSGAYEINRKYIDKIKDKKILLIDDIITSGATVEEIINCFLDKNISNITCLIISKAGKQ